MQASASWGQGSTASTLASALASALQTADGAFLTASSSGGVVTITSLNSQYWAISVSVTDTNSNFSSASFSASASGMSPAGYTPETAYSYNVGYDGVGNTTALTDSVMGGWSYSYDTLNRLVATGQVSSGPYNGQYGCWTYDGFGNRTMEAISGTPCTNSPAPTSWAHFNSGNQITGTGQMTAGDYYDAAGDVTNDGTNAYLYDGAGRICAAKNLTTGALTGYIYDGEGNRVAKGSLSSFSCNPSSNGFSLTTQYILGLGGEQLTELNGSNQWQHTNAFAGGALLATYEGSDTYFNLTDWQGTKRAETGAGGCISTWSSLPFGNNLTPSGNCPDATEHHYTGKIHDSETGNDDFGARYYSGTAARWLSPDWAAAAEAVPYATFTSPQTLNLYVFVGNNPLSSVDPDGHQDYRVISDTGVIGATDGQFGLGGNPSIGAGTGDTFYDQSGSGFGQANGVVLPQTQTADTAANTPATPYVTPGARAARDATLGILNGSNGCSEFFNSAAAGLPDNNGSSAAQVFAAVDIRLNPESPSVGARTEQDSGKNGPIFVNPNGPFFKSVGIIDFKIKQLSVAPGYSGGTLRTQELILLHELGHKLGAIPADTNSQNQSVRNTETVIKQCRKELNQ